MKTVHEYEASDIDLHDPVHSYLSAIVTLTLVTMIGSKPKDAEAFLKEQVAHALTMAERQGIVIAVGEPVPEVFRDGR